MSEASPEPIVQITPPIDIDPNNLLVKYIYPIPGSGDPGTPDLRSVNLAGEYEIERHRDEEVPDRRHLMIVTEPIPLPAYIPGGREVTRYTSRKAEGWWIHPWVSVAGLALTAAIYNGPPIAAAVHAEVARLDYRPTPPRNTTIEIPGRTITIPEQQVASPDKVGSFAVNKAAIIKFRDEVEGEQAAGNVVTAIHVASTTSDEFASEGGDNSISEISPDNTALGDKRAATVEQALDQAFDNVLPAPVHETVREHVISKGLKSRLERLARHAGIPDLITAVEVVDSGEAIKGPLESDIEDDFVKERGVDVGATIQVLARELSKPEYIPGKDDPPPGPQPWDPFAVTVPPVRRRELVHETREKGGFWLRPGPAIIPWPRILKEDGEHVLVRVLRQAELPGGKLVPHVWAYTRKFLHLFREYRIPQIMRADFKAADGSDKSFYTLFVDHTPTDEEVQMLLTQMPKFAAVQGGRLADKLTLAIHPSSQAGRSPDKPWRIGPTIDKQYGKGTLGVCTPIIGIGEVHMETDDIEGLGEALDDFRTSPEITIDHEIPGHGSSIVNGALGVLRAFSWRYRHARVPDRSPWRPDFASVSATLNHLADPRDPEAVQKQLDKLEFDVQDVDEQGEDRVTRMSAHDPRLHRGEVVTIVGYDATQYAGEHFLENAAETIAAGFSGRVIPFEEAAVPPPVSTDKQANSPAGYRPDEAAQEAAAKLVGGIPGTYPIEFEHMPEVRITLLRPEDDPVIAKYVALACGIRFPKARHMLAILAGQTKHEHRSKSVQHSRLESGMTFITSR